jgi:AraC family transcriptional regulator, transcriptional activator of pobA
MAAACRARLAGKIGFVAHAMLARYGSANLTCHRHPMLEGSSPVYKEAVWATGMAAAFARDGKVPVYALAPGGPGEMGGFRIWDFKYHDGYSILLNGARPVISARHCHPHFEIFFIRKGRGLLSRDCELIEVRPHSLLIIGPGDIHFWVETENLEGTILTVSETFTSHFNFSLPFDELVSFLRPHGSRTIALNPNEDTFVASVFEVMDDQSGTTTFEQSDIIKAFLLIVLGKIKGFHASPAATPATSLLTKRFEKALLSEFPRLATVKEFAEYLGSSRSYLHRAVMRDLGSSPSDLIRERIIYEGKRMLLHTTRSPGQIAQHLGFTNGSYFASFFRRHTNLSPKAFRSQSAA